VVLASLADVDLSGSVLPAPLLRLEATPERGVPAAPPIVTVDDAALPGTEALAVHEVGRQITAPLALGLTLQQTDVEEGSAQYDYLFHETQRRTVEEAAIRVTAEDDDAEPESGGTTLYATDAGSTLLPPRERVESPVPVAEQAPAGDPALPSLIAWVPGVVRDEAPPPGLASPISAVEPEKSELDGRTVNRSQVRALAARIGQQGRGPAVLAVRCPVGHLNPPHSTNCRLCGALVRSSEPETAPRPILGILRLSTGDTITLDRDVILGRSPDAPADDGSDRPHVVRLHSPNQDISRNHLQVRLDGWHVLVTDLHSTNGTEITLPGQAPQALREGEAVPIVPGTVVNLAEEVSFVYEVQP
jgi:hypothetical protein